MDDLLPSYERAMERDPWQLVAPYLPSTDLCSAALVCQKWHGVFAPQLWGSPASHFGIQNDMVYVALTRFKRTLFWARRSVRAMTHTLHLPPAHAEIYGGPHSEWLRDILERLPQLQCLIVNGLPFFDHASLLTLRYSSPQWRSSHPDAFPVFGLRLLDASNCANATSMGLAEALRHLPELVYLDLSKTYAARDPSVFTKLPHARNLRILRLRGLNLKDSDFSMIAASMGKRVRSLDIGDNQLTDASTRVLLEHCMNSSQASIAGPQSLTSTDDFPLLAEIATLGRDHLDQYIRKRLTTGFAGRLAIEGTVDIGVTHLYLSNNKFTIEGISGLLRSGQLQVLDVGSLPDRMENAPSSFLAPETENKSFNLPGVEKVTLTLARFASEKLRYLRINHAVVTKDGPSDGFVSAVELEGSRITGRTPAYELDAGVDHQLEELDAVESALYELKVDDAQPAELPGSPSYAHTPPGRDYHTRIRSPPTIEVSPDPLLARRGSMFAPEPLHLAEADGPLSHALDATGGLSPLLSPSNDLPADISEEQTRRRSHSNSINYVADRRANLQLRQSREHHLHPGMLPKVHTLVLTDVPLVTEHQEVAQRIIQFIKDCAEEAEMAKIRARHTYALAPGRTRAVAEREYARSLFALQRIVLEMAPPETGKKKITTSWRQYPTKSSTEDADTEAFWEAATHDFSFFGDEECGLPTSEPDRPLPLAAMDGLMLAEERPTVVPQPHEAVVAQPPPVYDVLSKISVFRKTCKAAYQTAVRMGEPDPVIEGHWTGEITVFRKPVRHTEGDVDFYGNRYEAGYLYR